MACRMDVFTRAKELGIQTEFVDGQGQRHVTDATALKIILDALPQRVPYRFLDETVVIRSGEASRTGLNPAAALPVRWKIAAGSKIAGQEAAPKKIIAQSEARERTIVWPSGLPEGSYRLHLTDATGFAEAVPLIVSPLKAYGGDF